MASATIRKVWVIKGLVDYDGTEMVRYLGFQMASARIKTIKDAWAFGSYEGAFQQLNEVAGEGTYEVIPVFVKKLGVEDAVVEETVEESGGTTVPPVVE